MADFSIQFNEITLGDTFNVSGDIIRLENELDRADSDYAIEQLRARIMTRHATMDNACGNGKVPTASHVATTGPIASYFGLLGSEQCEDVLELYRASEDYHTQGLAGEAEVNLAVKNSTDLYLGALPDVTPEFGYIYQGVAQALRQYVLANPWSVFDDPADVFNYQLNWNPGKQYRAMLDKVYISMPQVQHYKKGVGGYPTWHVENTGKPHNKDRRLAYLVYLNTVEVGGETEFLGRGLAIKPTAGTVAIFPGDASAMHRGNVPISSDKYIITGWIQLEPKEEG